MDKERKKLYDWYRENGMTEEQIKAIKEFDDKAEKSDKEYYAHTVPLSELTKAERRTHH